MHQCLQTPELRRYSGCSTCGLIAQLVLMLPVYLPSMIILQSIQANIINGQVM